MCIFFFSRLCLCCIYGKHLFDQFLWEQYNGSFTINTTHIVPGLEENADDCSCSCIAFMHAIKWWTAFLFSFLCWSFRNLASCILPFRLAFVASFIFGSSNFFIAPFSTYSFPFRYNDGQKRPKVRTVVQECSTQRKCQGNSNVFCVCFLSCPIFPHIAPSLSYNKNFVNWTAEFFFYFLFPFVNGLSNKRCHFDYPTRIMPFSLDIWILSMHVGKIGLVLVFERQLCFFSVFLFRFSYFFLYLFRFIFYAYMLVARMSIVHAVHQFAKVSKLQSSRLFAFSKKLLFT